MPEIEFALSSLILVGDEDSSTLPEQEKTDGLKFARPGRERDEGVKLF